jgi:hypothetical protein
MNKQLYKLIFLIDKNPLVKGFNNVEEILKNVFAYKNFKELKNEKINLVNEESRIYEIQIYPGSSKDNFIRIKITGYNIQKSDCYYLLEDVVVFGKSTINELKNLMKEKDII